MKEEKDDILNGISKAKEMSELDLLSDSTVWMLIHRMSHTKVNEREFIKKHEIIRVDRNDELMIILSKLRNSGGLKVYWDGTQSDKIFFFVGISQPNKAYTKRYKEGKLPKINLDSGSQ